MYYHEDFLMPGIAPSFANSRKQIRQRSKSLIYARLRPQRKQRRTTRDLNFGVFWERAMTDVFAIMYFIQYYILPSFRSDMKTDRYSSRSLHWAIKCRLVSCTLERVVLPITNVTKTLFVKVCEILADNIKRVKKFYSGYFKL